jgi:3-oxoacyl-[acyl-carrier protein] reductase
VTISTPSALITGASRGIGLGVARLLAERGWSLTINARDDARLSEVRRELEELGGSVRTCASDVADDSGLERLVAGHGAAYGGMNALILVAGVGSVGPIDGYPMRRFDKQIAVNLRAPFALVGLALPLLRAGAVAAPDHGGRIVALASIEGLYPQAGLAAYGAAKAALISFVRSINIEEGAAGIVASAISPGFVDTEMSAWTTETVPVEEMLPVSDVVKVVDLVLSVSPSAVLPHIVISRAGAGAFTA